MKFEPQYIEENVNVSHRNHGREFLQFAVVLIGIIFIVYLVLGFVAESIVLRLPLSVEITLGEKFMGQIDTETFPRTREYVQKVLDKLVAAAEGLPPFSYRVDIIDNEMINALALPAGRIVVYSGLLKEISSENALAMVLAHELGHYVHRDHLRGLGRGLVFMSIGALLSASGQNVPSFLMPSIYTLDLHSSRDQEEKADNFALDLMFVTYKHVGGVLELYDILQRKNDVRFLPTIFSTHPDTLKRKESLQKRLNIKSYRAEGRDPLPAPEGLPFSNDQRAVLNELDNLPKGHP